MTQPKPTTPRAMLTDTDMPALLRAHLAAAPTPPALPAAKLRAMTERALQTAQSAKVIPFWRSAWGATAAGGGTAALAASLMLAVHLYQQPGNGNPPAPNAATVARAQPQPPVVSVGSFTPEDLVFNYESYELLD